MIELVGISKNYAGTVALDDVNFHVGRGELGLVTGPSGAGKSTLLRVVYLAERPDAGTLRLVERDVTRLRSSSLPYVRRNLGVVFQDFKLLWTRSALENVRLPLDILGLPRQEVVTRSTEALEQVGVDPRRGVSVSSLSGGEQQRVALARALVGRPAILLCDEPTGNLDAETAESILQLIASVHEAGTTVCIATHDPVVVAFATRLGARRLHLTHGRVQGGGVLVSLPTRDGAKVRAE